MLPRPFAHIPATSGLGRGATKNAWGIPSEGGFHAQSHAKFLFDLLATDANFLTARLTAHGYRVDRGFGHCVDLTANSRVIRRTITLLVYVALRLGSAVLGISHKPAATSGSVMALEGAPKLPIDISEAF